MCDEKSGLICKIRILIKSIPERFHHLSNGYSVRLFQTTNKVVSEIIVVVATWKTVLRALITSKVPIVCLKKHSDVTFYCIM